MLLRVIGILALAVASVPVFAAQAPHFVGSTVCRNCHGPLVQEFYRNPHFKSIASGKEKPENTGCEGCHGPASDHIDADGGSDTIPRAFSLLKPNQILDTCLRCHSQTVSRANIRRSVHTQQDVVCTNCHSVHSSKAPKFLLASAKQMDLCYSCHSSVKAQFAMPFKHRVNEGFIQCTDCHNPHGTFSSTTRMAARPRMVDQAQGNEQPCLKCHIDKRGPFVFEHAAVRVDGCETCHNPHGSVNARLLKRPVVATVCLECHTGLGNFGRRADPIPRQSASHNMADPRFQNCTSCHVRIHGSNADSFFFR
jgi:DmsE family decaheme c-type cytochrome